MPVPRTVLNELSADGLKAVKRQLEHELFELRYLIDRKLEYERAMAAWERQGFRPTAYKVDEARRAKRIIEIMRLARRGMTNAEIGAKVELSASRVGQIIRAELSKADPPDLDKTG